MQFNLEIEYKMLICEETFNKIKNDYSEFSSVKQVNTYYDSKVKPLKELFLNLRIREIQDQFIVTLKQKQDIGLNEYEFIVSENSIAVFDTPEIDSFFSKMNIQKPLHEIGTLTTYRTEILFEHGTLCIDKSEYYNHVDYELEFEISGSQDKGFLEFSEFLKKYQLTYIQNNNSKTKRCIQAKLNK